MSGLVSLFRSLVAREGRYFLFPLLCACVATLALLLTTFSAPFSGSLFFFKADYILPNNKTVPIVFGTFGFCWQPHNVQDCSPPKLGYQLDDVLFFQKHMPSITLPFIMETLVIHAIGTGISLLALIFFLLAIARCRISAQWSFIITGIGAFLTLILFVIDCALFSFAKTSFGAQATIQAGNGIWFTLLAWTALFSALCYHMFMRMKHKNMEQVKLKDVEAEREDGDADVQPHPNATKDDLARLEETLRRSLGPQKPRSGSFLRPPAISVLSRASTFNIDYRLFRDSPEPLPTHRRSVPYEPVAGTDSPSGRDDQGNNLNQDPNSRSLRTSLSHSTLGSLLYTFPAVPSHPQFNR